MAKKKNKKHAEEEGGEAWLLPYSDLMTLLLAVFIVLFAVSKVDQSKAEQLAESFNKNMMSDSGGILPEGGDTMLPNVIDEPYVETPIEESPEDSGTKDVASQEEIEEFLGTSELKNLEEIKSELDAMLQKEDIASDVATSIDARGLVISLSNAILFESGSAEIKIENQGKLLQIAKIISSMDYYIRIEGHTDNIPIHSEIYPSNWELSAARAASVVRLFINECDVSPEKVVTVGYGEYKPIADNSTPAGRAKNRRIDIIVMSEKYNNLED